MRKRERETAAAEAVCESRARFAEKNLHFLRRASKHQEATGQEGQEMRVGKSEERSEERLKKPREEAPGTDWHMDT